MCKCTPSIRTPFCGTLGCQWPEEEIKVVHTNSRRFVLQRLEDVSGVSGTGIVAEGVEFVSGMVALSWLSPHQCVNVYHSMRTVEELHGHQNRTKIEWVD